MAKKHVGVYAGIILSALVIGTVWLGAQAQAKDSPGYLKNQRGQTYGSAAYAQSPGNEPDLILVVATNGREGYVSKVELSAIDGSNVRTPEEALKWQRSMLGKRSSVPVYASDAVTRIGEFVIVHPTQDELDKSVVTRP